VNNVFPDPHDDEAIAHAAAAWVLREDRGLTATEQDEFSQWLASDPRHGAQLARHRKHWRRLESLAQWRPEHSALPNPDLLAPPRGRLLRFVPAVALAAAAAIAVFFVLRKPIEPVPQAIPTVVERAAPVTQRILEDGTVVELNKGAVLSVNFTAAERRVRLEQGEAHFSVTKNPARPFIVTAHGMDVFAVGTAFNVRLDSAVVEVLVTEGRVRVSEAPSTSPADAMASVKPPVVPLLEAGQRAVVSLAPHAEAPKIATLTRGEIERVLSWQHRMLDFTAAPLAEVVAEFNRRNTVQMVIVDPELAGIRISATFRSDNIDAFVRLVEVGFATHAERRGENEILLRKAR
jgi:transmembrane sensor